MIFSVILSEVYGQIYDFFSNLLLSIHFIIQKSIISMNFKDFWTRISQALSREESFFQGPAVKAETG